MTHTQDAPRLYELRQRAWPVGAGSKQRRVPSTLVSRKAIIDLARASRSSGLPQDGMRAQPLLFFGQQRVDELRLRCNSTGTHSLRRRASETRTVTVRLAARQSLLGMTIRLSPHMGLDSGGQAGDANIPPPHA